MPRIETINLSDQVQTAAYGLTAEEFQRMLDHSGATPETLIAFALARLSEEFGTRIDTESANDVISSDATPANPEETTRGVNNLCRLLSQGEDDANIKSSPSR